ncbi:MAG TPA: hypothetical protein VMR21_11385, partial [Vicinamibacteria bacterium]|nr:hypothetical protein [Vicinamibacteria bacterium]
MTPEFILAAAVLGGAAATYLFEDDASVPARLCMGVPLGLVGLGLAGFVLGWGLGLSAATAVAAAVGVLAAPVAAAWRAGRLPRIR